MKKNKISILLTLLLVLNLYFCLENYYIKKIPVQNVTAYFSLKHDCTQAIVDKISNTKNSIYFAVYMLTDKRIVAALIDAKKRGVEIKGVVDKASLKLKPHVRNAMIYKLIEENIDVNVHGSNLGLMHHKFIIFDREEIATGSFNWTFRANQANNENIIFINSRELATEFFMEFKKVLWESNPVTKENKAVA